MFSVDSNETLLSQTVQTGATAAIATTAVAAICGVIEDQNPVAPINAISHIAWGDEAAEHDELSVQYTATGVALNTMAVVGWAGIYELILSQQAKRSWMNALVGGAAVSGLAFITDYCLVPKRVTPGFEKRLSNRSLLAIYTALALSFAFGGSRLSGALEVAR